MPLGGIVKKVSRSLFGDETDGGGSTQTSQPWPQAVPVLEHFALKGKPDAIGQLPTLTDYTQQMTPYKPHDPTNPNNFLLSMP